MQRRYRGSRGYWRQRTALAVAVAACFAGNFALANPTGPAVAQGQATFATQGNTLTVTNTPGAVINWQGFSIAGNEIARFIQQSQSSSVLNRVVGINPSAILGTLQSNGRVFLVNPNGITIGPGANIDVAGFMASTLNLSDADFLAGRMRFTQTPGAGSVVNHGTISTASGGMVYLVGQDVQNSGIIRSPQGEILLAAGKSVELVDAQTPEVRVQLTAPDNQALNIGQLIAAGGRIGMYGSLVRNAGVASANTAVLGENGKIVFRAVRDVTLDAGSITTASGAQGGSVTVQAETGTALLSGTVAATGGVGGGGTVQIFGERVGLTGSALVDVSGASGGGSALLGGDYLGSGIQQAARTYIGADALIRADATGSGDGGRVIVWSNEYTGFYGTISARGGSMSGNGGFVETSSHDRLQVSGMVNAGAANGSAGTWLLDPSDISIVSGSAGALAGGIFDPTGASGSIGDTQINTALNSSTDVIIRTAGGTGGNGDITINTGVAISNTAGGARTLTLEADRSIITAGTSSMTATGGGNSLGVVLNSNHDASGDGAIFLTGVTINTNGGNVLMGGGAGAAGNAIGTATHIAGIGITGGTSINAGAGSITMRGQGAATASANNIGIEINSTAATSIIADGGISLSGFGGTASANSGNHGISMGGAAALSVTSNGAGNITLNGTGGGSSTAPSSNGVVIGSNTTITTGSTGNISITGQGGAGSGINNAGVEFANGPITLQSTSTGASAGAISITGTGGGTGSNANGVWFRSGGGANINVTSARGDISLSGMGSATGSGSGVMVADLASASSTQIASTGAGAITLTGTGSGGQPGIVTSSTGATSHAIGSATMTGALTLRADTMDLAGTLSIRGAGDLIVEPLTASTSIGLAGGAGTLNLTTTELGLFQDGFNSITIGGAAGSGALIFGDGAGAGTGHTFSDSLLLRNTAGGGISVTDVLSAGANNLTLSSGGSITQGAAITAGLLTTVSAGGTTLNAANAVTGFNASNTVGGNIELANTAAPLTVTGISQAGGGDVVIGNTGAIVVGGATVTGGDLTLTSSAAISQTGAISAGLLTTSSNGGTVLNSANAVSAFNAANIGLGNVELTNTITTLDLQGITQNNGNVIIGNNGAITQSMAGITTAANGSISVSASTDLTISQFVTAGGAGTVTLAGGNITNTSTITGAGVTLNAGTGTFINESSPTLQGIVSNGGGSGAVSVVADNVDMRTGGAAGDSQINAGNATVTVRASSANRNYDLGTETGGRLSLTATELDTINAGGIAIGSTGNEGNIDVSAAIAPVAASRLELLANGASGSLSQTAAITVGDLRLVSTGAIALNAANSVTNLAIGGGSNSISFTNAGTLNIATVNGQAGVSATGGNVSITAGGTLNVNQAVNTGGATGSTTLSATSVVIGADIGNSSAATALTATTGNITRSAGTVTGTDVKLDAQAGVGTGSGSRVFTAADNLAARSTVSGDVFVSESDAVTLTTLSGVANGVAGGGAYDLAAGGTISVANTVNVSTATGSTSLSTSAGNIALAADVGNSGNVTTLVSAGDITRTAGAVIGSGVLLDAATGIGTSGARVSTSAGTLAARTGAGATGGIFVTEADNVSIGTVSSVSSVSAGNGGAADIRTTAGDITLAANVSTTGSGNVTLIAGGGAGNDLIAGAGRVSTGSGLVTLQGDAVGTTAAPVLTDLGSGTLAATSGAGDIAISNNTAAGLNSNQLTGFTTGGGVQTISVAQTAGNLSLGGSLNVGADVLMLGAAGDIVGNAATTLTASALTLDAGGLIGGANAVNTSTSGTLTLNSGGTAAAGNITVSEAGALPVSRVSLGGSGTGNGRTVSLTSVAGPVTLDAVIGNAADHLTLVATAGNIAGGAGTATATNLTLNAAGGIGAGSAVKSNTSGNLSLTTAGNAAAGDIALVENNTLNNSRVTALSTTGTGTQAVSITAPSITLDAGIGAAADNLTLIAGTGTISGAATVTANDLRFDAFNGIGATGTPVFVSTAGNLAARLTNASASGAIVISEVAAGAGMTVGTANGISGVTSTNNRAVSLAADSGNIILNQSVNSGSGQIQLTTTSSGNVSVGATVSGGLVNISAAGTIADSAQITGTTLTTSSAGGTVLDFGHAVTGFNASNVTSGNIQLVNVAPTLTVTGISQNGGGDVIINNTGVLTISGAINNAGTGGAINLTGSTGINLNQNLTATDGNITLNNTTTLGANVQLAAGTGDVTLTGATGIGANNLTVSSSGVTVITGGITGTTGNVDIAAATRTDVDGAIALSGAGAVQLDRAVLSGVNVTTVGGNITFDGVTATNTGPLQVGSGGGDVLFNNTLTLGSGAGLTVLSGAGLATFTGAVDGPAALAVTASGNTVFSSAVGAGTALASLGTDGGGLTQLNGGAVTTTGGQIYSDAVTLGTNATLAGAGITFSSTFNSAGAARTLQINDSGTTTFSGAVGNTLALASVTTNTGGTTAINGGSLATTGAQTYNDAVTLGVNTTLTGVDITFNSALNSSGAARTLQINDSGTTTFGGLVGNTLALASLTTNTGGTTAINAASLNTTGAQTYNDAVTLGANATLTSSGGSDIRFMGTLDGPSGLTVNTAGNTIFSAAVGGTTPLASLITDAAGSTQVNGGAVITTGAQTYNDGITIAGPTTFNATATTAALNFNATLAAATQALTLSADEINFAGGAGSVTGSGFLTLQPNNTAAAFNIGSVAGATVGALDLAATDLAALGNGFSAINLGQAAGTHAITIGNAAFQDPLLVRTPAGGSISVSGALSSTENIAFNAGGTVQGGGSVTGPRITFVAGGIGSLAIPLQLNTPDIDLQNSAGNAVVATAGSVNLLNNFSNTAAGGELRLIANNGAINTGAVAVQSAGGRIALIANDTTGGATGNIIVGAGGITSAGGDIALHAADNITINGAITSGAGNVRMLAGTGPGINAAHASFTGTNPPAPTELATDDFGFITFNAPVSAANMVLVSSTSATPTVVSTITQTAAGSIATTGALTAVTLRGAGAPGNGGGTVDLNDATGNNSTGLINLFACSFDGCPNTLPTVPFVNQGAPVPPFTTAVYSDGQLFYSDVGGTNVTGIGTSGDFTLYTPGSVSITGPSLSAKNLTIEALVDINVNLLAPFTNNDINGGQPGGSLNFIAGQNVNYTSMVSGATIGTAAVPFNHDLRFLAAGNVTVANAIYVGAGNFVVRANEPASLNNNTVNIPATGTGSVFMQGNHVVSSTGDLTVSGINLTVQGSDTGSTNQSVAGQQLLSAGTVNLNLLGDVTVNGGTATGGSDSAAIIRAAVVNVGSAGTAVANLSVTGGNSTVAGTTNHEADARIEGTTALNVRVAGDVGLTGGTAVITGTAGSSQKAGASAILKGNSMLFSVAGNVTLTGGTANAATGGNTATANAQVVAGSAFNPVILGDLDLVGGSATAQPIAGEIANAVAGARFESQGDLLLKVSGNINLQGGNAVAVNNTGGTFAEADAGALVRSGARVGIEVGQNFGMTGGSAVATGSGLRAIGSAGVSTGDIAAGESLLIKTAGNMSMTGGSGSGAAADAAALIYSAAEAKLNIGGPAGLRLEGGTGPFFPPFSTGVFTPNSNLFHMIGGNSLVRLEGSAYPITVTGLVTVVNNPALGAALFISEAPPLSLDSLLAAFIKTTDCVSFSGGACTLSGAVASGSGKGGKDPVGGVCK